MEKKPSPFRAETLGAALFLAWWVFVAVVVLLLLLWGLLWLFAHATWIAVCIVTGAFFVISGALIVQWLDHKYGWFDLDNF